MATDDFFRARLDQMIDLRHPLAVLAGRMPWAQIEAALAPALAHKNRDGSLTESVWSADPACRRRRERGRQAAPADAVDGVAAVPEACVQLE